MIWILGHVIGAAAAAAAILLDEIIKRNIIYKKNLKRTITGQPMIGFWWFWIHFEEKIRENWMAKTELENFRFWSPFHLEKCRGFDHHFHLVKCRCKFV